MKSLSIVLLGTQMAVGGAQKLLLEQALWFQSHGYKVAVLFFYDRDGLYQKWMNIYPFEIQNLHIFDNKEGRLRGLFRLLHGLIKLWSIFKQGKFDAAITFTHDSNVLGLPIAWLAGIPVRIGTHLGTIRGLPRWREKLHSTLVNLGVIQVLIASSNGTRDDAVQEGVSPKRIEVVFNAISPFKLSDSDRSMTRQKLGLRENDFFLLAVGRLVYEKGHVILIRAMPSVVQSFPNIMVGICGSGPMFGQLQEQISALALDNKVRLLGQWENVLELLAAADAFVLPSRWEGLPMALLEAMMAGLPVIASRVQGVEEVIENGVQGLLVPLENPEELSKAILQLLNNPDQRRKLGLAASFRIMQGYTTEQMCENYLKVVNRLIL